MLPAFLRIALPMAAAASLFAARLELQAAPLQSLTAPAGAISGVIVDGSTGDVLPGSVVQLLPGRFTRQVADSKGRFAFLDLPPGDYRVTAMRSGYLEGGFGRDSSPTDPLRVVRVAPDGWVSDVRVTMWRPGSLSGVVRDETGAPVVGVFVRVIARVRIQGRDAVAAGPLAVTDDRGAYRIAGLVPGRYVVQVPSVQAAIAAGTRHRATPFNEIDAVLDGDDSARLVIGNYPLPPPAVAGRRMSYPPAFHPAGVTVADAATLDLAYGDDRAGVDVTLSPVPASRVSGIVEGPADALTALTLRLLPAGLESLGQGAEVATALAGPDGRFTFLNIPAGAYTIDAPLRVNELVATAPGPRMYFPVPPGRGGWNRQTESVDGFANITLTSTDFRGGAGANHSGRGAVTVGTADVDGVVVRLQPNARMSGRIVVEDESVASSTPAPARFDVMLDPAAGEASHGMPQPRSGPRNTDPPGLFTIDAIAPGRYWLRAPDHPGWQVKSIVWRGRDYINGPFDAAAANDFSDVVVTMTSAVPELSGSVRGTQDLPAERTIVVAFPVNPAEWRGFGLRPARLQAASVSSAGTYELKTLPAGEYLVAAIDRRFSDRWRDPEVLAQVARSALRLTLQWGTMTAQNVSVVVVR